MFVCECLRMAVFVVSFNSPQEGNIFRIVLCYIVIIHYKKFRSILELEKEAR
jgi:hypothetical protein